MWFFFFFFLHTTTQTFFFSIIVIGGEKKACGKKIIVLAAKALMTYKIWIIIPPPTSNTFFSQIYSPPPPSFPQLFFVWSPLPFPKMLFHLFSPPSLASPTTRGPFSSQKAFDAGGYEKERKKERKHTHREREREGDAPINPIFWRVFVPDWGVDGGALWVLSAVDGAWRKGYILIFFSVKKRVSQCFLFLRRAKKKTPQSILGYCKIQSKRINYKSYYSLWYILGKEVKNRKFARAKCGNKVR